jgi:hypothetical protein
VAARRARKLGDELLEGRMMLAQTTGLFFHDPGTSEGYVLFSPNLSNTTYLIDKDANVVNTWQGSFVPGLLGYLQPDGSLIRATSPNGQGGNGFITAAGAGGLIERFDWDGNLIWDFDYSSETYLQHHDFEVMPNGNILLIAWELKSEDDADDAGRNPLLLGPGYLYPDTIIEVEPDLINGGGTIVWEWHVWDHLVQEYDLTPVLPTYYGPNGVEDHPELIDLNYVSSSDEGGGAPEDWTHANGIDYNAELDQVVLSVREFSEFWVIDHSTTTAEAASHSGGNSGKGGDLLYRWGNPQTYDRGDASDRVLFYQHDAQWIPDGLPGAGNITVFNNGWGRPGTDYSSVEEITTTVDGNGDYEPLDPGEPHGPASATWTYAGAVGDFASIISSAQRLPNGNTLIDYGIDATFSEVTSAGVEVWRYVSPYTGGDPLGPEDEIPLVGFADLHVNFAFQAHPIPVAFTPQLTSTVAGRHIFYNQSAFDGSDASINSNDDGAIAPDKTAYLPGAGVATYDNLSNYSRGINGIIIDLVGGGAHASINANDFLFKVGNNNSPSTWAAAAAPNAISVRTGAGVSGSDRVEITWAANAVKNTWLEVQVLPTSHTGLALTDVFFWGNRVGDTTSPPSGASFVTNVSGDGGAIVGLAPLPSVGIANRFDVNKTNSINVSGDRGEVVGNAPGSLLRINVGTAGPFAPEGGDAGAGGGGPVESSGPGDRRIASALASSSSDSPDGSVALPAGVTARLDTASSSSAAVAAAYYEQLTDSASQTRDADDDARLDDESAVDVGVDSELLDALVVGLLIH